ncbi:MAG: hypothetical protein PUC11_05940 [Elusimicrobia bacterium]|nr:hypothetical protein [Elusimicrobiota bacterium]
MASGKEYICPMCPSIKGGKLKEYVGEIVYHCHICEKNFRLNQSDGKFYEIAPDGKNASGPYDVKPV